MPPRHDAAKRTPSVPRRPACPCETRIGRDVPPREGEDRGAAASRGRPRRGGRSLGACGAEVCRGGRRWPCPMITRAGATGRTLRPANAADDRVVPPCPVPKSPAPPLLPVNGGDGGRRPTEGAARSRAWARIGCRRAPSDLPGHFGFFVDRQPCVRSAGGDRSEAEGPPPVPQFTTRGAFGRSRLKAGTAMSNASPLSRSTMW